MSLTAELRVKFSAAQIGSNDISNPEFRPFFDKLLQFASGTGADQADIVFADSRNILASGNDDLDLAGVLTGAFGVVISAAEVVGLLVINKSLTQTLSVGGGSNPWAGPWGAAGDIVKIGPRGVLALFAPDANGLGAVVAGTGDILRIANNAGGAADYDIGILARTA